MRYVNIPPQARIPSPTRKANMLAVPYWFLLLNLIGIISARDKDRITLYSIP